MDNQVLALVGSSGFLGQEFVKRSKNNFKKIIQVAASKGDYSIDRVADIKTILNDNKVTHVINFAALTSVELADQNPLLAITLNVTIPQILQEWASQNSAYLLHVSTDQVYDSELSTEKDISIKNVYAATKYLGERFVDRETSIVLRTNFVGKPIARDNFGLADWIVNAARQNKKMHLFTDVFFNPLHLQEIILVIDYCLANKCTGLFNIGALGSMSKADFAIALFQRLFPKFDNYVCVSQQEMEMRAVRPGKMVMNCNKFQQMCGYTLPTIQQTIECTIKDYENE